MITRIEAANRLRQVGLIVRDLGGSFGIAGGGYRDCSTGMCMIEDGFSLRPVGEAYEVSIARLGGSQVLPLEGAVDLILRTVPRGVDIPLPTRSPGDNLY
jgi:hypothetical protein